MIELSPAAREILKDLYELGKTDEFGSPFKIGKRLRPYKGFEAIKKELDKLCEMCLVCKRQRDFYGVTYKVTLEGIACL